MLWLVWTVCVCVCIYYVTVVFSRARPQATLLQPQMKTHIVLLSMLSQWTVVTVCIRQRRVRAATLPPTSTLPCTLGGGSSWKLREVACLHYKFLKPNLKCEWFMLNIYTESMCKKDVNTCHSLKITGVSDRVNDTVIPHRDTWIGQRQR